MPPRRATAALFLSALFASLPLHAAAAPSCTPLEAIPAAVADAPFLVLGDVHGTREVPAFVAAYLCAGAKRQRSTTLAIELPSSAQDALDAFWPARAVRRTSNGCWEAACGAVRARMAGPASTCCA